jgi:hypothetical protein
LAAGVWELIPPQTGLTRILFHDLPHTGHQLIANAGANPRELTARMGHDNPRAALIYLHSSAERQRDLAAALGDAARAELAQSKKGKAAKSSGTGVARGRRRSAKVQRPDRDSNAGPTA